MTPDEVRAAALLYPGLHPADAWQRHPQQTVGIAMALVAGSATTADELLDRLLEVRGR